MKVENSNEIKGKAKGGKARADKLSPEQRSEIAKAGAKARHKVQTLSATHEGYLKIEGIGELLCYVLEDGTRVFSQRGINKAFGRPEGGTGAENLPSFLGLKALNPFINKDLTARLSKPLRLIPPRKGNPAFAQPATILAEICDVWLKAREADVLKTKQHLETAKKAEILTRAFAKIGIIALVDEATGYQGVRPKDALQQYLEKILRKELAAWAKKFPDEFYENIYKLKGWPWPGMGKNRYSVVAHYTRDLIYERIAPGLLNELEQKEPPNKKGQRKNKLHQWLTDDVGDPLLAQHMHSIIMFQRLAIANGYGWQRFLKMVGQVLPKKGDNLELDVTVD